MEFSEKEMEKELAAVDGKTTIEALEIRRTEDWIHTKMDEVTSFINEHRAALSVSVDNYLNDYHPQARILFSQLHTALMPAVVDLTCLFMKLGYLKGTEVAEDKAKLEKLLGGK